MTTGARIGRNSDGGTAQPRAHAWQTAGAAPRGALQLEIVTRGRVQTVPLPESGALVIGRAPGLDVVIDDASVSRRHAVLQVGARVTIKDAGSANGTWVRPPGASADDPATQRDVRLPVDTEAEVRPGDALYVGSVLVVLTPRTSGGEAPAAVPPGVVVRDPAVRAIYDVVARVAPTPLSVLLLGETGVGKEVFAEAIHRGSSRAAGPFVRLNCAALAEQLLESELFGHEKGSFTGAVADKPGLFEVARGGTVFLDEVGELPPSVQAKLLRVLEERKVLRVGALAPRPIDVRFVAATHRDLEAAVERGAFRRDLYFRLNGITLVIPPLRERLAEVEDLAQLFLRRACEQLGRADDAPVFDPDALAALRAHPWPGNVRELRNVVDRAVVLCTDGRIRVDHLGLRGPRGNATTSPAASDTSPAVAATEAASPSSGEAAENDERQQLLDALEQCVGNQTLAAEMLGVSRRTLINRMERFGISGPRKRR